MKFGEGNVGFLSSFKYFMDRFDASKYVNNLILQGSNDDFNLDVNDIVTIQADIHEGWNYYNFEDG